MKFPPPSFSSSSPKRKPLSACLITLSFILFIAFLYGEDFACVIRRPILDSEIQDYSASNEKDELPAAVPFSVDRGKRDCDLFEGEWIYDEEGRPQYEEEECPYIQPQLTCQSHGRPDSAYQHLRWQPRRCYLPRQHVELQACGEGSHLKNYRRYDSMSTKESRKVLRVISYYVQKTTVNF